MLVNEMSPTEAADNWELPLAAIEEVIEYCSTHESLLKQEAQEGRRWLQEKGVLLEPANSWLMKILRIKSWLFY